MNQRAYFITGTDTDVGKTYVVKILLSQFNQAGLQTIGLKPIASGALKTDHGLINNDAVILQQSASIKLALNDINPFVFEKPIAPHLAAAMQNTQLTSEKITTAIRKTMQSHIADRYLIEGAGGLMVPINDHETMADVIHLLNIPVILVIGIRLGCINHALLTSLAMTHHALTCAGWIANCLDPHCEQQDDIILTLQRHLSAPCLQKIPFMGQ